MKVTNCPCPPGWSEQGQASQVLVLLGLILLLLLSGSCEIPPPSAAPRQPLQPLAVSLEPTRSLRLSAPLFSTTSPQTLGSDFVTHRKWTCVYEGPLYVHSNRGYTSSVRCPDTSEAPWSSGAITQHPSGPSRLLQAGFLSGDQPSCHLTTHTLGGVCVCVCGRMIPGVTSGFNLCDDFDWILAPASVEHVHITSVSYQPVWHTQNLSIIHICVHMYISLACSLPCTIICGIICRIYFIFILFLFIASNESIHIYV